MRTPKPPNPFAPLLEQDRDSHMQGVVADIHRKLEEHDRLINNNASNLARQPAPPPAHVCIGGNAGNPIATAMVPGLVQMAGDLAGGGDGTSPTLVDSGVTAGAYGSSTAIPVLTVDAKGRLTSASTAAPTTQIPFPTYNSGTTYASGQVVAGSDGNLYRAIASTTGNDPTTDGGSNWELWFVRSSLTLSIATSGGRFALITTAWAFLQNCRISSNAVVTLSLAAGTYTHTSALNLNHPDGDRISIQGAGTTTILNFSSGTSGIVVTNARLGGLNASLNGLKIVGTGAAGTYGILANQGASVICGTSIRVETFAIGIGSNNFSFMFCQSAFVTGCKTAGIAAFNYANVNCAAATATLTNDGSSLGDGFQATVGSTIYASGCTATSNRVNGFEANGGCRITIGNNATISNNATGVLAFDGSFVFVGAATVSSNTLGVNANRASSVSLGTMTLSGNTTNYSPTLNTVGNSNSIIMS